MGNTLKECGALPLVSPYVYALGWADAYARAAESWFDWNRAGWQQLIDAQAEWLRQWSEQFGGPLLLAFIPRGTEQLA